MIGFTGMSSRWEAPMLRTHTHTPHRCVSNVHRVARSARRAGERARATEGEGRTPVVRRGWSLVRPSTPRTRAARSDRLVLPCGTAAYASSATPAPPTATPPVTAACPALSQVSQVGRGVSMSTRRNGGQGSEVHSSYRQVAACVRAWVRAIEHNGCARVLLPCLVLSCLVLYIDMYSCVPHTSAVPPARPRALSSPHRP